MYINIGKSKINYQESFNDNFMILSEVVNSNISFEKPTLVNNINELDIWFGRDFNEYNYLKELLNSGISLYLYRPISSKLGENNTVVDLRGYTEENKEGDKDIYYNPNITVEVTQPYGTEVIKNLPKIPNTNLIYRILTEDNNNDYVSYEGLEYSKFIYQEDSGYINLNSIEDKTNTKSFQNRDTLFIDGINNVYYNSSYVPKNLSFLNDSKSKISLSRNDLIDINVKNKSLAWKITDWSLVEKDFYICIQVGNEYILLYSLDVNPSIEEEINKICTKYIGLIKKISYKDLTEFKNFIKQLELGFIINQDFVYSLIPRTTTYFCNKELYKPSFEETQNVIRYCYGDNSFIKFYSKTIGSSDINGETKITIKKIEDDIYNIRIDKFDYFEIFEGPLKENTKGLERIDSLISKNSKLVYCEIDESKLPDKLDILEENIWKLYGGLPETYEKINYENGINALVDNISVPIDFILIPDIDKYSSNNQLNFLDIAKNINCQILLQNTENNYKSNILDKENRLIYFYKDIKYGNENRPGYYLYLKGLISGKFSETSNKISYDSPGTDRFNLNLTEENLKLIQELKNKKSNYLVYNGQYYYYESYLDGEDYETTGWMRFAISKISRELDKVKRYIVGLKSGSSRVRNIISKSINKIKDNFSIIYSIKILNCLVDFEEGIVLVRLETTIDDLVKSNITIDITINYNKN